MTTKQTIDGVPRELLRWLDDYLNDGLTLSAEEESVSAQLRALLDALAAEVDPIVGVLERCLSEGVQPTFSGGDLKHLIRLLESKPAPQPQGEPVAWQLMMNGDQKEISGRIGPPPSWENLKRHGYRVEPLYAKQPAPVVIEHYKNKVKHLKQLLRNVRATLHFSPEDVLAIDAALREDEE